MNCQCFVGIDFGEISGFDDGLVALSFFYVKRNVLLRIITYLARNLNTSRFPYFMTSLNNITKC